MTAPSGRTNNEQQKELSRTDVIIGAAILVGAQLACASTASCVHALPEETPSVLRGLWRQTLTSIIFGSFALILLFINKCCKKRSEDSEKEQLLSQPETKPGIGDEAAENLPVAHFVLVALAVVGAALLNDTIVVALEYASSAAVMCLCNTTPIWLILYAIIYCGAETPGVITVIGAGISLVGAILCATAEGDDLGDDGPKNESLGAIIATIGGIGGAIYMTACRNLAPVGINPIVLTLIINIGMASVSFFLCLVTLPGGITKTTSLSNGFFGFLNSQANPAALLHSLLPDCCGNFGIMIALSYFEPLIVSLIMLTEPLNASLIAMNFVGEAPPSQRTAMGVLVVLTGCGIVLWESSKEGKKMEQIEFEEEMLPVMEYEKRKSAMYRRRTSQTILFSPIGTIAPDVTAKAAFHKLNKATAHRRLTLPPALIREISMTAEERQESSMNLSSGSLGDENDLSSRRITLTSSIIRGLGQRLSFTGGVLSPQSSMYRQNGLYGAIIEEDDEEEMTARPQ